MSKTYIITDTHFNGKVYSAPDYTEKIFENWALTVQPTDTIIHGGDICSGRFNLVAERIKSMPGRKILTRGNHDSSKTEKYLEVFDEVHLQYVKDEIVYSHFPVDPKQHGCQYNVFGHFHRYPKGSKDSLILRYRDFWSYQRNFTFVIEDWEFKPVDIEVFVQRCFENIKSYE